MFAISDSLLQLSAYDSNGHDSNVIIFLPVPYVFTES